MNEYIEAIIKVLSDDQNVDKAELERATFDIIEMDEHHELPRHIQSIIYDLNMDNLNKLSADQYKEHAMTLSKYIQKYK